MISLKERHNDWPGLCLGDAARLLAHPQVENAARVHEVHKPRVQRRHRHGHLDNNVYAYENVLESDILVSSWQNDVQKIYI